MKRCVAILMLIFANIILFAHTIVAHHHHNGYVVVEYSNEKSHHDDTSHNSDDCENCNLKNIALTKQLRFVKQITKLLILCNVVEGYISFKWLIKGIVVNLGHVENLYDFTHIYCSFGRAPPTC